jgi:hypothetical protein
MKIHELEIGDKFRIKGKSEIYELIKIKKTIPLETYVCDLKEFKFYNPDIENLKAVEK